MSVHCKMILVICLTDFVVENTSQKQIMPDTNTFRFGRPPAALASSMVWCGGDLEGLVIVNLVLVYQF